MGTRGASPAKAHKISTKMPSAAELMQRALLAMLYVCSLHTAVDAVNSEGEVTELDIVSMQNMLVRNDKAILLLYATPSPRADEFVPTLQEIAQRIPGLPFGKIDVKSDQKIVVSFAAGIEPSAPALRAFFKNAPPGKRVLEYRGPPTLESVLAWAQAVADWDGSDKLAPGWEVDVPEVHKTQKASSAQQSDSKDGRRSRAAHAHPKEKELLMSDKDEI